MVTLFKWENKLFSWLNRQVYNRLIKALMVGVTQMGSGAFVTAICLLAFYQKWFGIIFSVLFTQLVVQSIKRLVRRTRPYVHHSHIVPVHPPKCQYSFPSGHTASAFTLALGLSFYLPNFTPLLLTFAFLVAVSRMVLGVHYPTDVIAGMLIAAIAFLVRLWVL